MEDTEPPAAGRAGPPAKPKHEPPPGADTQGAVRVRDGHEIGYAASAGFLLLRERDKPVAEIFSVAYTQREPGDRTARPVTFVFNGGPGASSAYLHVGALGPSRVAFGDDGSVLPPPARLVDNEDSWLAFSDLVFVDPVGTGFSRTIDEAKAGADTGKERKGDDEDKKPERFFGVNRDLESLGEFISRWLSDNDRWASPVFIAGESYGGFRAARLARLLPERYGVGLSGSILISPALEFALLDASDYDVLPWVDRLPTMAAAAAFHGRSRAFATGAALSEVLAEAERFAGDEYATLLIAGASAPAERRAATLERLADLVGLPADEVARSQGRIGVDAFTRGLLRDEGRVVGAYDATISARDPFPDRSGYEGPDPTLSGIESVFASAVNQQLRGRIGVRSDREYRLLSLEVNESWTVDGERHALDSQLGATDDLRYAISLNPHLRVFLTHGRYDLITPYYASDRLRNLMRLDERTAAALTTRHFGGGHMFYAWRESREAFGAAIAAFYGQALGGG